MVEPAPPEPRRLTAKGRATRDRILAAAAELIVARGLSALNMVGLRTAASVSGSQLAHYFTDKQVLVRALIERQIQGVLDFHQQPVLGGLDTFDDFERWLDLTMRDLRRIGFSGTPTYHGLVGQLAKTDDATRATLADGYRRWISVLEGAIGRMKTSGLLVDDADPRQLALVIVGAHQAGGTMASVYQEEWPQADALRFAVNRLRMFAADPAERAPRPPRRPRTRRRTA
ncbi:TetR/AcrR family transcriptional regulator [Mycobacterium sp. PS03-16]|uniref:TetR/AcrR family transcriptional regulator n=1 Tax=Mycobacterium sp. PS03-16 TaxID=2559611 RepID=UPI001073E2F4|nr:TetR/AcrR family transcriptional regulator [Mycobacterium sp. PS03-16]TFV61554.1 TetR/AcrR family transcriptional regulator [Mycobacterium sp. PS03-16]